MENVCLAVRFHAGAIMNLLLTSRSNVNCTQPEPIRRWKRVKRNDYYFPLESNIGLYLVLYRIVTIVDNLM